MPSQILESRNRGCAYLVRASALHEVGRFWVFQIDGRKIILALLGALSAAGYVHF